MGACHHNGAARRLLLFGCVSTNLSQQLVNHLHQRLVQQAVPESSRLTGRSAAKLTLELALKLPLADALVQAVEQLSTPGAMTSEQAAHISATAMKLIIEGLRIDDAVTIALHEPAHPKASRPIPEKLRSHMFPPALTGQNVLKHAVELNAWGMKMDEAIVAGLRKCSAPRPITQTQAEAVLDAAQTLFKEGRAPAEAFDLALRRTLPKHD